MTGLQGSVTPRLHPVTFALAVAAGVGWLGFPGLLWDVAWHRTIGRDSFLSPPHVLMYAGVAANGLVAAWALTYARGRDAVAVFGRPVWRLGRATIPAGFAVSGLGFLLAITGAVMDEVWHRLVGKDVNLWSPPHLLGLGGTALIAIGLALAVAAHTRYGVRAGQRPARLLLLFLFADLIHKSMVALDHYTLDAWGRTPDFYPFLLALLLPAILITAVRAIGPGAATGAAVIFTAEHVVILLVLLGFVMRIPTFSPCPILPALAVDLVTLAAGRRRDRAGTAVLAGIAFVLALAVVEAAWMAWVVGKPWPPARVAAALPGVLLTGAGSAWVGWAVGGWVCAAASDRPADDVFSGRSRAVTLGLVALVLVGLAASYRPSRGGASARLADLGLAADTTFDYRDAVFWEAQLPDDWREPGVHRTYQEGIVDGRPFPIGPAWCAPDQTTLARELDGIRFGLSINGEAVALERYPRVARWSRGGEVCQWVAVSAFTPRPGRQALVYELRYGEGAGVGDRRRRPGTSVVAVDLVVKEP